MKRLAILGGGFMGRALAQGLIDSGWDRHQIIVVQRNAERRRQIENDLRLATAEDAREAVPQAKTLVFAVKPQGANELMDSIADLVFSEQLVITIMAGVTTERIENKLGPCPVIRAMPNTPASIGLGVTALAKGKRATDTHLVTALNILSAVGKTLIVEESQMDAVTAVSGSGPAYLFYLAENMIEAAMREGLNREQAYTLTYQTFIGAAQLLWHDAAEPADLRRQVTSPGGTTAAAIHHLESQDWAEHFKMAIHAARLRSEALGA